MLLGKKVLHSQKNVISVAFNPKSGFCFSFGFSPGIWGFIAFYWKLHNCLGKSEWDKSWEVWDEVGTYSEEEVDGKAAWNAEKGVKTKK